MAPQPFFGGDDARDLSTAVIITNWNYGHFLNECIGSAVNQTTRPTEVIVVDDGSTDGSAAVLEQWANEITVVKKPNGGQASAFNAGFQKSSSDIVLFLDADDLLRPEAIETILTNWSIEASALSFGLETIDFTGRSQGIYAESMIAKNGDNRPDVLRHGVFTFPPTSGNAFNRNCLKEILPMDESRWAISADLYLLTATALHGRMITIRSVLGSYRIHSGNNHYVASASRVWVHARGLADMAAAIKVFADMPNLPADSKQEQRLLRIRLRLCSLEILCRRLEYFGAGSKLEIARQAFLALGKTLSMNLPISIKIPTMLFLLMFAATSSWIKRVRVWMADVREVPRLFQYVIRIMGFGRVERLLEELNRSRWPEDIRVNEELGFGMLGKQTNLLAEGWMYDLGDGRQWSKGSKAVLEFSIYPPPGPVQFCIGVEMVPFLMEWPIKFEAMLGDVTMWIGQITGSGTIAIDVPPVMLEKGHVQRLTIRCQTYDRMWRLRRFFELPPRFSIQYFSIRPAVSDPALPYLPIGPMLPISRLLGDAPDALGWALRPDGSAAMIQPEATLTAIINRPDLPLELQLVATGERAKGRLRILCSDIELYAGQAQLPSRLRLRLPKSEKTGPDVLRLSVLFFADDPLDRITPAIREIGVSPIRSRPLSAAYDEQSIERHAPIAVGQRISFDTASYSGPMLGSGWSECNDRGVANSEQEAELLINVDSQASDLVLHIE
ncbi:MAG: glycosyltransferase family 2 protein, partial [Proteobacteria bacterium]|nr:glycosyltransferase family 2 protein [Pseudomonadota bacterium]